MSSTYAEPFARLDQCLDEIGAVDPTYRTVAEKQQALLGLSRVIARAEAERLRVLAVSDDVAETTGDRAWWDLEPGRALGYHPLDDAEDFADGITARADDDLEAARVGGPFATDAYRRPAWD